MTNWKPSSLNPTWVDVLCTYGDFELPVLGGARIFIDNLRSGRRNYFEPDGLGLDEKVRGNLIEMAVAKFLNVFWTGNIGNPGADDVACYQVRGVLRPMDSLIIHNWDKDGPCISGLLLVTRLPIITLRGWRYGHESKNPDHWREDVKKPAYFWGPETLRPMSELPPIGHAIAA